MNPGVVMAKGTQDRGATTAGPPAKGRVEDEARPKDRIEVLVNGVRVEVSPELEAAVHRAYKGLFEPLPAEMTTIQAAEFLDVSRPFVVKLIKRGELPCRMVGTHHRIPTPALQDYREKMYQRAKQAADEMAQLSQDQGLYDLEGPPPNGR
jgi:excisionase family DNA binding protein